MVSSTEKTLNTPLPSNPPWHSDRSLSSLPQLFSHGKPPWFCCPTGKVRKKTWRPLSAYTRHGTMNYKKGGDDSRPLSHILSEVTMSGGMKILPEFPPVQGTIIKEMTKGWEAKCTRPFVYSDAASTAEEKEIAYRHRF